MCSRYQLSVPKKDLRDGFTIREWLGYDELPDHLNYEFFPSTAKKGRNVPIIFDGGNHRALDWLGWGFTSSFPKGNSMIFNTRSETILHRRIWQPHLNHRCILPLTGAIEWQHQFNKTTGEITKRPHVIQLVHGGLGAIAGIYDPEQRCCSMLTCRANPWWQKIHNADPDNPRMICFLQNEGEIRSWLNSNQNLLHIMPLLRPAPTDWFECQPPGSRPSGQLNLFSI